MEAAKEDMTGEKILSIDEDDKMWSKTGVGRPRATLALRGVGRVALNSHSVHSLDRNQYNMNSIWLHR
jgi:hypothetical protein